MELVAEVEDDSTVDEPALWSWRKLALYTMSLLALVLLIIVGLAFYDGNELRHFNGVNGALN